MNIDKHAIRKALVAAAIIGLGLVHVFVPGSWPGLVTTLRHVATASIMWSGASVTMPVWLIGILWTVAVTAIGVGVSLALKARRKTEPAGDFLTTAVVFGIRWRWNYRDGEVCELASFCPKCDLQVLPVTETRHGFLHLLSYSCACRKWRSRSYQCSQASFLARVGRTIQQEIRKRPVGVKAVQHA